MPPVMIDAHVHLYPDMINRDPSGWAERAGERHWATLCTRRRKGGQPVQDFPSVETLLRTMDEAGVERAILLSWYWEHLESCRLQNRFYAECIRAHPDRLCAFASVHPGEGRAATCTGQGCGPVFGAEPSPNNEHFRAALSELDWAREHGLCGLGELSPHSVGWSVDDPLLAAILERAGDWGWPVNLHVTEPDSRPFPGKVETPLGDFLALAETHPRTRFILAHWGGGLVPVSSECEAHGHSAAARQAASPEPVTALPSNLFFDTAASPLIYGAQSRPWKAFVAAVGADRILFGSDYPLNLYPALCAQAEIRRFAEQLRDHSGLTRDEIRVIGGDNARSLLGLC